MGLFERILEVGLHDIKQYIIDNQTVEPYLQAQGVSEIHQSHGRSTSSVEPPVSPKSATTTATTETASVGSESTKTKAETPTQQLSTVESVRWKVLSYVNEPEITRTKVRKAKIFIQALQRLITEQFTSQDTALKAENVQHSESAQVAGVEDAATSVKSSSALPVVMSNTQRKKAAKAQAAKLAAAASTPPTELLLSGAAKSATGQITINVSKDTPSATSISQLITAEAVEKRLTLIEIDAEAFAKALDSIEHGAKKGSLDKHVEALFDFIKNLSNDCSQLALVMNYETKLANVPSAEQDEQAYEEVVREILELLLENIAILNMDAFNVQRNVKFAANAYLDHSGSNELIEQFKLAITTIDRNHRHDRDQPLKDRLMLVQQVLDALLKNCADQANKSYMPL